MHLGAHWVQHVAHLTDPVLVSAGPTTMFLLPVAAVALVLGVVIDEILGVEDLFLGTNFRPSKVLHFAAGTRTSSPLRLAPRFDSFGRLGALEDGVEVSDRCCRRRE